jgi:hypothetical protein
MGVAGHGKHHPRWRRSSALTLAGVEARLVITAVVVERRSQAEVAREHHVSKGWVSKPVARYRAEDDARSSLAPGDRRRHRRRFPTRRSSSSSSSASGSAVNDWTPAPTRSVGTSSTTTRSGSPGRRSTAPRAAAGPSPGPPQAAPILVHPLRRRAAQRAVAGRLHPLPPRHRRRRRDPVLAR